MDWSKLPDLAAVTLLATAFAAVARRSQAFVSTLWLTGWIVIALHFGAQMFASVGGLTGALATFVGLASLTWAGMLFMWASVPHRKTASGLWLLTAILGTNSLYIAILILDSAPVWALDSVACLFGALPLALTLARRRKRVYPMQWALVGLNCGLSAILLLYQNLPGVGLGIALNAVFFTVYFECCLHFMYAYRRRTVGAFITISGFFGWAAVFVIAPALRTYVPSVQFEGEVWNLPKYVVAFGMILLLLEDQIEHNKYLALHDDLTGLPNRRLFQDRLSSAVERARRTGSCTALLLVDLDHFKLVNDTLGHHVGDQLLKRVGAVLSDRVRRSDTVARTGGDEFSVILDYPISREDAEQVGQSLIELLAEPYELGNQTMRIEASIGIALFPADAADCEGLCIAADLRMYGYKHKSGRFGERGRPPASVSIPAIERQMQSSQAV